MTIKIERGAVPGTVTLSNHDGSWKWSGIAPQGVFERLGPRKVMYVKAKKLTDGRLDLQREVGHKGW